VARRLVQQQRYPASRIRLAQETEERLEMRLLHVRATQHDSMPRAEVDGTKQDPFRILSRNGYMGLFAL
jgi:hypothetical protein